MSTALTEQQDKAVSIEQTIDATEGYWAVQSIPDNSYLQGKLKEV